MSAVKSSRSSSKSGWVNSNLWMKWIEKKTRKKTSSSSLSSKNRRALGSEKCKNKKYFFYAPRSLYIFFLRSIHSGVESILFFHVLLFFRVISYFWFFHIHCLAFLPSPQVSSDIFLLLLNAGERRRICFYFDCDFNFFLSSTTSSHWFELWLVEMGLWRYV